MSIHSDTFALASFVVALVVTLGAVPLCAHLLAMVARRPQGDRTLDTAGAGLFVGVALASFYLDAWPAGAAGLAASAAFVLAAGTVIDVLQRHGRLVRADLAVRLALSAVAICGVMLDLDLLPAWTLGTALLIGAAIPVLVATAQIGHDYEVRHPGLTVNLTLASLGGLVLIGWIGRGNGVLSAHVVDTVSMIAIPAAGALLAAAYYMIRLPWRGAPVVFAGTGGHMMLAVAFVWVALTMALSAGDSARASGALVWAVAVPLFYFVREQVRTLAARGLAARPDARVAPLLRWLEVGLAYHVSPMLLPAAALFMSAMGALVLYHDVRQLISWPAWLAVMCGFILLPAAIRHTRLAASGIVYRADAGLTAGAGSGGR